MKNRDGFSSLHPLINFYYYIFVIVAGMFFMHPVYLLIALLFSFGYALYLGGAKTVRLTLLGLVPLMLIGALSNPLFNHAGATILGYFKDGNPLTLESIVFGIAAAAMFAAVILWFSCYNQTITSDKFLYLFGKAIPKLGLIFSMILRFVPLYQTQLKRIRHSQLAIGRDIKNGNIIMRIKNGLHIFSILVTWALENAIITADSMQARGYGLKGRRHYSLYRFDSRDLCVLSVLLSCTIITLIGAALGYTTMRYFPSLKARPYSGLSLVFYGTYTLICLMPLAVNYLEERKWKSIESNNLAFGTQKAQKTVCKR